MDAPTTSLGVPGKKGKECMVLFKNLDFFMYRKKTLNKQGAWCHKTMTQMMMEATTTRTMPPTM